MTEAINTLGDDLRTRTQPLESDTFASALSTLQAGLSSSNSHTATAAIEVLLLFWPLIDSNASLLKAIHLLIKGSLIDKLGDSNKRIRELAGKALLVTGKTCLNFQTSEDASLKTLESIIKDQGFASKQARTRESCLIYLREIRKDNPELALKQWMPCFLATLEDPDASVRETARENVVAIFADPAVPEAARADLKKELSKHNVRGSEELLARLLAGPKDLGLGVPEATPGSSNRTVSTTSVASAVGTPVDTVQPVYIASPKDMESEFAAMLSSFEGKETEHNWIQRDKYINRIRGMLKSEAHVAYLEPFVAGLRLVMNDILKISTSLRTTLATATCKLLGELAEHLKTSLDPFYEPILSALLKIAAQTKKLVVHASEVAMGLLIANCSYSYKGLNLLCEGMQAKPISIRQASAVHTKTMLSTHGGSAKAAIENSGGLDLFVKILQKGITDPTAGVREASRAAYWVFSPLWPKEGQNLLDGLDPAVRSQVQKSANGLSSSTSTKPDTTKRPSVRAMIAAKKTTPAVSASPEKSAINSHSEVRSSTALTQSPASRNPHNRNISSASTTTSTIKTANGSPPSRQSIYSRARTSTASTIDAVSSSSISRRERAESASSSPSATSSNKSPPQVRAIPKARPSSLQQSPRNIVDPTTPTTSRKLDTKEISEDLDAASLPGSQSDPDQMMDASFDGGMIEAAMADQASQAEQAAHRLLELVEESEDPKTPMKKSLLDRLKGMQLQDEELKNSPAEKEEKPWNYEDELGVHSWWLASTEMKDLPEALPPTTFEQTLHNMIISLAQGTLQREAILQLRRLSADHDVSDEAKQDHDSNYEFWTKDKLFNRLFGAIQDNLKLSNSDAPSIAQAEATLALLKDLVLHQTAFFSGQEIAMFALLLYIPVQHLFREAAVAARTILAIYMEHIDPLYALVCLRGSLTQFTTTYPGIPNATATSFAGAIKSLGSLFLRLPAEVLEDEIPKTRDLLLLGMASANTEVRQSTVSALCAAAKVLKDDTRLFAMLDGLTTGQISLLTYFFARSNDNNNK